jgi:hypothetical protein
MKNTYKINDKIYFYGDTKQYLIVASENNYAIATRAFDFEADYDYLQNSVDNYAFISIEEAYEYLKNKTVYTIIDFEKEIRGSDNYGGKYSYDNEKEISLAIADLIKGEMEISHRNNIPLDIKDDNYIVDGVK